MSKAPFPWYGGKQYLAPALVDMLPPHEVYVEVFGGAGSLLFSKAASRLEVYNDLDSGLVNFFRVLRDENKTRELKRLLDLTPYAREEWRDCSATWQSAGSEIEMARRWFMAIIGSFGKHMGSGTGWSFSATQGHDKAHSFRSATAALGEFTRRLQYVQVEHGDFARMMKLYDGDSTLFYCDPPYMPETRTRQNRYRCEMTTSDHVRLLETLQGVRGMVMLSGYRSSLYDEMLADWDRRDIGVITAAGNRTRTKRTESIWLSPSIGTAVPMLFPVEVYA